MIGYTIDGQQRQAKTEWHELTLGEYVALRAADLSTIEGVRLLSGLTVEECGMEGAEQLHQVCASLLDTEPAGVRPDWLPLNLGAGHIGRMELCRQYLREHEEQPEEAFPFLYAVYRWPERYDALLAISGAGFPSDLVEEAKALKVTEAIGAVYHILSEMNRLDARYGPILSREPTEEQLKAGVEKFEKYGFYATLLSYCSGDLGKAARLLETPADVFYTALCIDTEKADYEEKYRDIINKQG